MKKLKKNLANAEQKLTRDEMKSISAGTVPMYSCVSASGCSSGCSDGYYCSDCGTCTK